MVCRHSRFWSYGGKQAEQKSERHASTQTPLDLKRRKGVASTFSEIAQHASSVEFVLYDRSREDGATAIFMVLRSWSREILDHIQGTRVPVGITTSTNWLIWKRARLETETKLNLPLQSLMVVLRILPTEPSEWKKTDRNGNGYWLYPILSNENGIRSMDLSSASSVLEVLLVRNLLEDEDPSY